jgi:prepilin-type N-terminal cleavage/methylation domain-containing protein
MMRIVRRLRRTSGRGEDGFSLVEMLSTMVVMGVLTSIVSTMLITSVKATHDNSIRIDQINSGRIAMESMTRVIRTAVLPASLASCASACGATTAFITATPTTMSFYADVDNAANAIGPSQIIINLDAAGNLTESVQRPDPGSATTGYTWNNASLKRVNLLAKGVQSAAGANLFTYYLFGSSTPFAGSVTGTNLANVDAVDILLKVDLPNAKVAPTTYVQRVSLPNVDTVIESTASPSP